MNNRLGGQKPLLRPETWNDVSPRIIIDNMLDRKPVSLHLWLDIFFSLILTNNNYCFVSIQDKYFKQV